MRGLIGFGSCSGYFAATKIVLRQNRLIKTRCVIIISRFEWLTGGPTEMQKGFSSCNHTLRDLAKCVRETKCVKEGGSIRECLRSAEAKVDCDAQRNTHFICKRSQLDMRSRIRGNHATR
ncbi:hypothetical protein AAMO2058_000525000 [Amorphochlora amoebiformis]